MTISDNFCPSPWIHARIRSTGDLRYCRWSGSRTSDDPLVDNIRSADPVEFFQKQMSHYRLMMLEGRRPAACEDCHVMERHGKVSGRQRQMIKVGIDPDRFDASLVTSTFVDEFRHSAEHHGDTTLMPVDWQVDLGNHCNSACLFCTPTASSRLRAQQHRLGMVDRATQFNWADDPVLVDKFMSVLERTPSLRYLHFLGGEPMVNPAFKEILRRCVDRGLNRSCTIGLTTNLTVWDDEINSLLCDFNGLNLGVSIETLHDVNEYLRWPARQSQVLSNLHRYHSLAREQDWTLTIRNTPTVFSVGNMAGLYRYAIDNRIGIESCNFLQEPPFMRPTVLPMDLRQDAARQMLDLINEHEHVDEVGSFNTRDRSAVRGAVLSDARAWSNYLTQADDESHRMEHLVVYLKRMEGLRNNSIIDYLPEYEKILRTAGY
jgi:organic radical activating enzyme